MSSGELLMTLREDWLRLRTDSLKFSGLANILGGILWPAGSAGPRTEAVRGSVLGAWVSVSMKASCAPPPPPPVSTPVKLTRGRGAGPGRGSVSLEWR